MKTPIVPTRPPRRRTRRLKRSTCSDYVRVLYKRRWIAIPVFLIIFVIGCGEHAPADADLPGRAQLLIEQDTPNVATLDQMFQTQDSLVQRRLLPDAVPHPAEPQPGEADDRLR